MDSITMHDFDDGRGEVPAHQHPKGGGWVEDNCEVSADSMISEDSAVTGGSTVTGNSWVIGSKVIGGSTVTGGYIARED